jgi:imidazolonepropionase-like amidohydrolase
VTALRAGRLFDGVSDTLLADPTVIIDGTTITAVGSRLPVPAGMPVIDLPGATLLPGLIDTHVHLAFDAGPDPVTTLAARDDHQALAAMAEAARTALRGGVTTVRDLGDRGYLALALRDRPDLPTILAAGPPITIPGGHCHFLGGAVDPTDAAVRAAVQEHADRGVDVIKIMASGGTLTPGSPQHEAQFPPQVLAAAVDQAHRLGLPITAHAHAVTAIADALAAGVDGLEHATFWTVDGIDARPELIDAIARSGTVVGATLGFAPAPGSAPPPEVARRLPAAMAALAEMHRRGAVLVAGTDAGLGPVKPPDAVRYAPESLHQLGMSTAQALRAVTSVAAGALGLGDIKGRLAAGCHADILAVAGDPLSDLAALHRIVAVVCRGALDLRSAVGVS